jgi:hypothetical protein
VKTYVFALLLVVGVLGGFYGGYRIGHNNVSAATNTQNSANRTGNGFGGGRGGGGGFGGAGCPSPGAPSPSPGTTAVVGGTVTDLSNTSFTISETACDVKVTFGNTVQVSKNVAGSTADLQDNMTITVIGTRQADGSINATTIQIGGAGLGRGFGNPGAQASPSPGG